MLHAADAETAAIVLSEALHLLSRGSSEVSRLSEAAEHCLKDRRNHGEVCPW